MQQKRNKIRIAFLIDHLSPGGSEKQLVEIAKRLNSTLFRVQVISLCGGDQQLIKELTCPFFDLGFKGFKSFTAPRALLELLSILKKGKVQILISFFFDATLIGCFAAKVNRNLKIICARRDLGFWHTSRTHAMSVMINRLIDRFWANSMAVANYLMRCEKIPEEKIDLIYNGIDLSPFKTRENFAYSSDVVKVGIIANLNRAIKRVDLFLRAAALVKREMKNIEFWIIGDGPLRPHLEELAKRLGVLDVTHFLGLWHDVNEILRNLDIGVLCSDSEGLSNSILEYMASGIPTVATDVGGSSEIIDNGWDGFLVPRGDYEMLAARILELVRNPMLRKKMGENAYSKVRDNFAWERKIIELEEYFLAVAYELGGTG